jgi:hypothetical protein
MHLKGDDFGLEVISFSSSEAKDKATGSSA